MATMRERLLKATDSVRDAIKIPFQVRKDKKSLESWIIDVEESIADLELRIEEAKGKESFNPDKILDLEDDLELKKRRLKQGETLMAEMFSDGAPELTEEG